MFTTLRVRRCGLALAATALLTAGTGMLTAGTAGASTAVASVKPDSQPPFDFCNNTGPNKTAIACFRANIEFLSRNTFKLTDVQLKDTANDSRAVYALVMWNGGYDKVGIVNGYPYTFENTRGDGTTATPVGGTHSVSDGVAYVYIALYASNSWSTSSIETSNSRTNPWY